MEQGLNLGDPVRALLLPVLAAVGLGTYLARAVPLLLALKARAATQPQRPGAEPRSADDAGRGPDPSPARRAASSTDRAVDQAPASDGARVGGEQRPEHDSNSDDGATPPAGEDGWLELVAPSVMTALLVGSVLPARWGPEAIPLVARHLVALAAAWVVARRYRHLGLTVLVGMAVAWLASAAVSALR